MPCRRGAVSREFGVALAILVICRLVGRLTIESIQTNIYAMRNQLRIT
jgi:hypothetical protein